MVENLKKHLKNGVFGVMSNGLRFVIVNERFIYKEGGWDTFDHVDDNLKLWYKDIDKLFVNCDSFDDLKRKLESNNTEGCVYDRYAPKVTEMTIEQIEKALGITNLKIKK